jgi:uncharacterized membrane protein YuzA (DUF378 family)
LKLVSAGAFELLEKLKADRWLVEKLFGRISILTFVIYILLLYTLKAGKAVLVEFLNF